MGKKSKEESSFPSQRKKNLTCSFKKIIRHCLSSVEVNILVLSYLQAAIMPRMETRNFVMLPNFT